MWLRFKPWQFIAGEIECWCPQRRACAWSQPPAFTVGIQDDQDLYSFHLRKARHSQAQSDILFKTWFIPGARRPSNLQKFKRYTNSKQMLLIEFCCNLSLLFLELVQEGFSNVLFCSKECVLLAFTSLQNAVPARGFFKKHLLYF